MKSVLKCPPRIGGFALRHAIGHYSLAWPVTEVRGPLCIMLQRELDKQRQSILGAEEELKRVLVEAEENLNHGERPKKRKGRMDSPHSIAQGVCVCVNTSCCEYIYVQAAPS